MKTAPILTFSLLIYSPNTASAVEKIYHFTTICENSFRYDPAKYATLVLDNTIKLVFSGVPDETYHLGPAKDTLPESYANFDFAKQNADCAASIAKVEKMEIVSLEGIEDYRQWHIESIKDECDFTNAFVHGFSNSSSLRDYKPAAQACSTYVDALEGKTNLEHFYTHLAEANCFEKETTQQCSQREMNYTPDHRMYVFLIGWHKCASTYWRFTAEYEAREKQRSQLQDEFKQLFKVKSSKCDSSVD